MIIATDIDSVVLDFDETWRRTGERALARPIVRQKNVYSMATRYGLTSDEYDRVWDLFDRDRLWERCCLIRESIAVLLDWQERGHEIHAVSSIPVHAIPLRMRQFQEIGLTEVYLHAAANPCRKPNGLPSKEVILRRIRPVFYADDLWSHCQEALLAGVPHVSFIESTHDGGGVPVKGVRCALSLSQALHYFENPDVGLQEA